MTNEKQYITIESIYTNYRADSIYCQCKMMKSMEHQVDCSDTIPPLLAGQAAKRRPVYSRRTCGFRVTLLLSTQVRSIVKTFGTDGCVRLEFPYKMA